MEFAFCDGKSQVGDFSAEGRKTSTVIPRVATRGDQRALPAEGLEPSRRRLKRKSVRAESLSCVRKQEYWHRDPDAGGKQRYRTLLDAWFSSDSTFLGKLDVESAVPEFPCSVGQLHHPDVWKAAGGPVTAIAAKVIQWQLLLVFDKSRCQPIFQIGFLKVIQDFRYDHWYKELVRPFAGSQSAWLWLPNSPLYLTPT
jgi:hypothetical protein